MNLSRLVRLRTVRFGAAAYAIVSLACARIPLVNALGYEFSAVIALTATWVAAWISFREMIPVYRGRESDPVHGTLAAFRTSLEANLLLLLLPLAVISANALLVKNCSFPIGLAFYICIPLVTVIFACTLALFCTVHYRHPRSVYGLFILATLAYAVALGYWTPAIFSYNFFYGYFPGLTYDEILTLRWPLVVFRVVTLLVALLLFLMSRMLLRRSSPADSVRRKGYVLVRALVGPGARIWSLGAVLVLGTVYVFRCDLEFESTSSYIKRTLGSKFETEHVILYYDSLSIPASEIHWVAAEHEFCLSQVWDAFVLPHRGRVESYVYPSAEAKLRLIGAGSTSIAKPWSRQVHIARPALEAVLRHELTHVVAGVFGPPVIRASLSPGLTEGLAVAVEGDVGMRTLHEYAAAIRHAGIVPDMQRLLSIRGFMTQSTSVSYFLAGSFCRYLIDRFGIRKMTQLYGHDDYIALYGRPLGRLLLDWDGFLDRFPGLPGDADMVDAVFRRPPIFGKTCARVLAERNQHARELLGRKDYADAAALFAESYHEGGSYEAFAGWVTSALRGGDFATVTNAYDSVVSSADRPAEYLTLFLQIGDAFWAEESTMTALRLYDRLRRADLSRGFTEAALLRALAIDDAGCAGGLLRYFLSSDPDTVRINILDSLRAAAPKDDLVRLLLGRAQLRVEHYEDALATLEGFDIGDVDARLESGRRLGIGQALFRLKRFQDAKAAFWNSLNVGYSDAAEASVNRMIDMCDWMAEHGLP